MTAQVMSAPMSLQLAISVELPEELMDLEPKLRKKLPGALRRIAMEGKSFWKSEAGRRLKSSRDAYQKAIDFKLVDDTSFYLVLEGFLPFSVEYGQKGFDMKPGFLANAKTSMSKRKFPRAVAATIGPKVAPTRYRIIPLNPDRFINPKAAGSTRGAGGKFVAKNKVFRTVTDQSPPTSWLHPGFKGVRISDKVVDELDKNIIPKHIKKLIGEL